MKDYPPANLVNDNQLEPKENYPIIRCEDCFEIPLLSLDFNKNEIIINCTKENKIKRISFKTFFDNINNYNDFNCCQLCQEKNKDQKYYYCKTCSKIMCKNCFKKHEQDDDIEKLNKIDSTCRKHLNPIESFCKICNKSLCSYCNSEHDENHKDSEIFLRDKILKKNKLEEFEKTLKKVYNNLNIVEIQINELIEELKQKIDQIINLKNTFFDFLNMKIKLSNLVYKNYLQKLNETDLNFTLIRNLEEQLNFYLPSLQINKNEAFTTKAEKAISYLQQNINNKFDSSDKKEFEEIDENIFNEGVKAENIDFIIEKSLQISNIKGYFDFNSNLYGIYDSKTLYFWNKKDDKIKFKIYEGELSGINTCKKYEKDKILVLSQNYLSIIEILKDCEYLIIKKYPISFQSFDFNQKLDLVISPNNNNNYGYNNKYDYNIYFFNKNKYDEQLNLVNFKKSIDKFQFIKDNKFFIINYNQEHCLYLYNIENKRSKLLSSKKNITLFNESSIIELNNLYYAVNNRNQIFLLNQKDLSITKTINIDKELSEESKIYMLKLSPLVVSLFIYDKLNDVDIYNNYNYSNNSKVSIDIQNYEISMNGIKWDLKKEKNIINEKCKNYEETIFIKLYKDTILLDNYKKNVLNFIKPKELDFMKK